MAKGKKTGGRNFVPGVVTNPNGRPPLDPEIRQLRKITAESLKEIADLILVGDRVTLNTIASSSTEPGIRVAYAKAVLVAMQKGDLHQIEIILSRLIGKVPDRHAGPNGEPLFPERKLSDEQLDAAIEEKQKRLAGGA